MSILLWILLVIIAGITIRAFFPTINIIGDSMYPTYKDGEKVKAFRVAFFMPLEVGKVYVYHAPDGNIVVKRLIWVNKESCYFMGDNRRVSYDSRQYGTVKRSQIIARVFRIGGVRAWAKIKLF